MWRIGLVVVAFAFAMLLAPTSAEAAKAKKYQVTGKVLEVTDDMIAVDKDGDRWEIERNADTKVDGKLKVGEKVTIEYRMIATHVEDKGSADSEKKSSDKKKSE
jgi:hypothetical protein